MPTYDYRCKVCGHKFESTARMTDPPPTCPKLVAVPHPPPCRGMKPEACGGETEKTFNGPRSAPQFKGPGWARDGYSKK